MPPCGGVFDVSHILRGFWELDIRLQIAFLKRGTAETKTALMISRLFLLGE